MSCLIPNEITPSRDPHLHEPVRNLSPMADKTWDSFSFSLSPCVCVCLSLSYCFSHRARRESSWKCTDGGWGIWSRPGGGRRRDISRSSPWTWKRRSPITHRRVASVAWRTVSSCWVFSAKRQLKKHNRVREAQSCFLMFLTGF
jgi:hypothetical protein